VYFQTTSPSVPLLAKEREASDHPGSGESIVTLLLPGERNLRGDKNLHPSGDEYADV